MAVPPSIISWILQDSGYEISGLFFLSTENSLLPTEVRKEALQLQKLTEYDDEGAEG